MQLRGTMKEKQIECTGGNIIIPSILPKKSLSILEFLNQIIY